jgi:hypothetical protein
VILSNGRYPLTREVDLVDRELLTARDLEDMTGTCASTWRYWSYLGTGPESFKLGKRRVWRKSVVMKWLDEQERQETEVVE